MTDHSDDTETRECVCGKQFVVNTAFAKPWTVCPACMMDSADD